MKEEQDLKQFALLRDIVTDEKQMQKVLEDRRTMFNRASAYLQHHDKNVRRMAEFILWLFTV